MDGANRPPDLQAAKETEAVTAEQHARESIRIARTTRELLKKFASFQKSFTESWKKSEEMVFRICRKRIFCLFVFVFDMFFHWSRRMLLGAKMHVLLNTNTMSIF